jgi:aldehyde:ferredoxin oxidoreductase
VIDNDAVRLEPAGELWGLETYATERALIERYPGAETITIGPAGENLVPMASLVHREGNNVAARCGMGTVAGSKRLKAVVARGAKPVPIADEKLFQELKREALRLFGASTFLNSISHGKGTAGMTPVSIEMNDLPVRNWAFETRDWANDAEKITGEAMQEKWVAKKDTCYACPIACKWTINAPRLDGTVGHLAGPEYESLAGLGAQTLVNDPLAVIQAADLCTRLGLDTISAGATIAWAIEAFERGILTLTHTDGLKLEWGEPGLVLELIKRIGENRPGIGALLARGSRQAAHQVGGGDEFAIQVKGLELPFHHPRAMRGLEIAYATLPRGASHNEEGAVMDQDLTYATWIGAIIKNMDLSGANSSMVYCQFLAGAVNSNYTARLLTAITGVPYTPEDLLRVGARTWYLRRAFNLRLGVGLEADRLPKRVIEQFKTAPNATLTDFDQARPEFYRQRELDGRGVPSARKLESLGLSELVPL